MVRGERRMKYKIILKHEDSEFRDIVEANTKDALIAELLNFIYMAAGYGEEE